MLQTQQQCQAVDASIASSTCCFSAACVLAVNRAELQQAAVSCTVLSRETTNFTKLLVKAALSYYHSIMSL